MLFFFFLALGTVAKDLKVIVPHYFYFFTIHQTFIGVYCVTDTRPYSKWESKNKTKRLCSWRAYKFIGKGPSRKQLQYNEKCGYRLPLVLNGQSRFWAWLIQQLNNVIKDPGCFLFSALPLSVCPVISP